MDGGQERKLHSPVAGAPLHDLARNLNNVCAPTIILLQTRSLFVSVSLMRRLPVRLLYATVAFATALVLIAGVSVGALRRAGGLTQELARRQLEALEDTERLDEVLFQKGYVSNYLVTHDRHWLVELEERKRATQLWLAQIASRAATGRQRALAGRLRAAYGAYDGVRDRTVAAFEAGRTDEVTAELHATQSSMNEVLNVAHELAKSSRADLLATITEGDAVVARTQRWIVVLTALTSLLSIGFGIWVTRRIARPIYELILQVENARPERVRLGARPTDELDTLTHHVRRLIGELDEQRRRLLQAEKMEALGEISAKLAHEILNPVAGAKAALQVVMRTTTLNPETRATIQEVDRTLSRIDGILSRLVRYSRPLEPRLQASAVEDLVALALHASRHEADAHRVRIHVDLPVLPKADLDPGLIVQVLTNLLVNAVQASAPDSEVRLSGERQPGALVLRVSDRGHGLPPARERLFRLFFTTRERGNGLGLATCQNIVAEHGGTIEAADGDGGVGAVFTVTLPQRSNTWKNPS
jgi:signal transduction histidine kinase